MELRPEPTDAAVGDAVVAALARLDIEPNAPHVGYLGRFGHLSRCGYLGYLSPWRAAGLAEATSPAHESRGYRPAASAWEPGGLARERSGAREAFAPE